MRLIKLIKFTLFYLKEVFTSNIKVTHDVLTKRHQMMPGFIAIPVQGLKDRQLLILSNLLTMTPGSVTVDISEEKDFLYLHVMYLNDPESFRQSIITKYVKRVQEVF